MSKQLDFYLQKIVQSSDRNLFCIFNGDNSQFPGSIHSNDRVLVRCCQPCFKVTLGKDVRPCQFLLVRGKGLRCVNHQICENSKARLLL